MIFLVLSIFFLIFLAYAVEYSTGDDFLINFFLIAFLLSTTIFFSGGFVNRQLIGDAKNIVDNETKMNKNFVEDFCAEKEKINTFFEENKIKYFEFTPMKDAPITSEDVAKAKEYLKKKKESSIIWFFNFAGIEDKYLPLEN